MRLHRWFFAAAFCAPVMATASETTIDLAHVPAILAVRRELPAPPRGVEELKFRDVFKRPVGPRGFEPSDALRALDGKRVRMVGFMVRYEPASKNEFLLAPVPVEVGGEDESMADDVPASAVLVRLPGARREVPIPYLPGLLRMTGVLHLAPVETRADGRIASLSIDLDAEPARAIARLARRTTLAHAPRPAH